MCYDRRKTEHAQSKSYQSSLISQTLVIGGARRMGKNNQNQNIQKISVMSHKKRKGGPAIPLRRHDKDEQKRHPSGTDKQKKGQYWRPSSGTGKHEEERPP